MLVTWFSPDSLAAKRGAWLLVALVCVLACVSCVCLGLLTNSSIDDIAGVEPYVVYTLSELDAGLPLYKDPQSAPFSVTQYAPLYYLLVHGVAAAFQATTAAQLTTLGRFVSAGFLLAQVGVCVAVSTSWLRTSRRVAAVVALAVVLTTAPWQVCARPDAMLGFFSLFTLVCALSSVTSAEHRTRWLMLATLVACASVFVKQSGIVNLLSLGALALVGRRFRDVLTVCVTTIVGLTFGVGWCFGTWGEAFFSNAVTGVRNGIQLDPALLDTFTTLSGVYLPVLVTGVWVSSVVLWNKAEDWGVRVIAVFALMTLGASGLLALKRGSAINYFNDYFVFALMLVGAVATARAQLVPRAARSVLSASIGLWLVTLFVRNLAVPVGYARAARGSAHDYATITPLAAQLRSELEADGGFALTRHAGLAAALAPRAILPMPAITDQLYADGIFEPRVLEHWLAVNHVSRTIVERVGNTQWYGPVSLEGSWCGEEEKGALRIRKACGGK